jgi:hypothetical protein
MSQRGREPQPVSVRVGDETFIISSHARIRMVQRQITTDDIAKALIEGESFTYRYHDEVRTGYFHAESRLFVGVAHMTITTVLHGVRNNYIRGREVGSEDYIRSRS